jgi:hypothetical protein
VNEVLDLTGCVDYVPVFVYHCFGSGGCVIPESHEGN